MRFTNSSFLIGAAMLLGCASINAQSYAYPPYAGGGYVDRYPGERGLGLFEHVEDDLNRAAFDVYGTRRHIDHARKEVGDVLNELRRGRFDRGEMGEAIRAVDNVLDHDRLPEMDRSTLGRDMEQMRRFRDQRY